MSNQFQLSALTITATGVQQASGAASAGTTIPNASSGEKPRYIRVSSTAAACFKMGGAGVAATTGDVQVQPGDALIISVPNGVTNFAVIQVTAGGLVQVSPLENM